MSENEKPVEDLATGAEETIDEQPIDLETAEEAERLPTPTLTDKEIEKIKAQALKEVEADLKKRLREKALAEEKAKLRRKLSAHDNPHLNGALSDLVRITIDIPEFSNTPWIQVNMHEGGQYFLHGQTYTVPRHVGNSLRETMQNMRRHQNEIDGKKRNRQLPDGRFVDVTTGRVTGAGTTISAKDAA